MLLARMARFVIADVSDAKSVLQSTGYCAEQSKASCAADRGERGEVAGPAVADQNKSLFQKRRI